MGTEIVDFPHPINLITHSQFCRTLKRNLTEVEFGCSECISERIISTRTSRLYWDLHMWDIQYSDRLYVRLKENPAVNSHRGEHSLRNLDIYPVMNLHFKASSLKAVATTRRTSVDAVRMLSECDFIDWNTAYRVHRRETVHGYQTWRRNRHYCYAVIEFHPILDLTDLDNLNLEKLIYLIKIEAIEINSNLIEKKENLRYRRIGVHVTLKIFNNLYYAIYCNTLTSDDMPSSKERRVVTCLLVDKGCDLNFPVNLSDIPVHLRNTWRNPMQEFLPSESITSLDHREFYSNY